MSGLDGYITRAIPAAASLPTSPAGRLAFAHDLLNGFPLVDDDGNETGERSEPVITAEEFRALVRLPSLQERRVAERLERELRDKR